MPKDESPALTEAKKCRQQILSRLIDENENELADLLRKCGQPLNLICTFCSHVHHTETKCKQKWCPVCVRAIATRRSLKFAAAANAMIWPLFVTLTVANIADAGTPFVRKLRRDFGKLRHRRLWKLTVAGGVAAIEVTNKGRGWHPHLHTLIDCAWLAIRTPRPQRGESIATTKHKCTRAKRELTDLWKTVTKEKHGVCWIQRASGEETAREVLKYSVKGSHLVESPDPIGPLIHQLRATRLTTSFGTLFGKKLLPANDDKPPLVCDGCKQPTEWIPEFLAVNLNKWSRAA